VVPGDYDQVLARDPVEVALGLRVLLLEPEGRQVARADDEVGAELVDLADRTLQQVRDEVRPPAVQVGELRDREGASGVDGESVGPAAGRRPGTVLAWVRMAVEMPHFQAYVGEEPPRFANEAELECAKILDYHGVPWDYEPRTFVLERDEEGRVTEAFTPDFYLPEQRLFLEITVMKQSLVTRKNRKLRKLRQLHPDIRVKLFYKRDIERLAQRYRLDLAS
jgi:hypothetical protein